MPRYRLIADHGHPFEEFDASDDGTAEVAARDMSVHAPTAKGTGYRLETAAAGDGWRLVTAWVPRWVARALGGLDDTVRPPESG